MKKKVLSMVWAVCMCVGLLAGCGAPAEEGTIQTETEEPTGDEVAENEVAENEGIEEDIAEITVSYWSLNAIPDEADVAMIEDAINAITESEINVSVNLNIMDVGTYLVNGAMANAVTSGEDFDLVLTTPAMAGSFVNMRNNGSLLSLNDLLDEYGQNILTTVPEEMLEATSLEGDIYAIPAYANKSKAIYYSVRNSVIEKAQIDLSTVKTLDDVEAVLAQIQQVCPDMIPISGGAQKLNFFEPGFSVYGDRIYDSLGDTLGAVFYDDETLTAVSWYETEEFKAMADYAKSWYDKGYVNKDLATDTTSTDPFAGNEVNASSFVYSDDVLIQQQALSGDRSYVKLMDAGIQTSDIQMFTWALPVSCDEKEAAMKFLNLMYSDEEIINLMAYGIEGTHYVQKEDGTIGFPEGKDATSVGYCLGSALVGGGFGNTFLLKVWEGAPADSNEKALAALQNAKYSPLIGFTFDTSTISDLYSALSSIAANEYGPALKCGSAPDGYYDEFIQKMHDAGLQEYLDEANRQIQEWKASK